MISLYPLVKNEMIKLLKKRRLLVVFIILALLIAVFTYAQMRIAEEHTKTFGTDDWHVEVQSKITHYTNQLSSDRIPSEWKKFYRVQIQLLQYYLQKNVDPNSPNAVTFTNQLLENAVDLFIPLLITVVISDIVSGELTAGTIKLLLTRPVQRWKVLLSKAAASVLLVSIIVFITAGLSYIISGIVFGYSGWMQPVFTGFVIHGTEVGYQYVHVVDQWFYLLMEIGLVWFSGLVVAALMLMISVLVRSTAAGMGIMLAALISGTILTNMVNSWHSAKYLFMLNLNTIDYLAGGLPPISGMNLFFSLADLALWAVAALVVSFIVFTRRDILN